MAQFTRFLRPGNRIIGNNDHNTIVAYAAAGKRVSFITVNYYTPQKIKYDLTGIILASSSATVTATNTDGTKLFFTYSVPISNMTIIIDAEANTIYSIRVDGILS